MVMVDVNVTVVPGQTGNPGFALIVMVGVTTGFTVMVIALLVAVTGEGQVRLLVISQVTMSPFARPLVM